MDGRTSIISDQGRVEILDFYSRMLWKMSSLMSSSNMLRQMAWIVWPSGRQNSCWGSHRVCPDHINLITFRLEPDRLVPRASQIGLPPLCLSGCVGGGTLLFGRSMAHSGSAVGPGEQELPPWCYGCTPWCWSSSRSALTHTKRDFFVSVTATQTIIQCSFWFLLTRWSPNSLFF